MSAASDRLLRRATSQLDEALRDAIRFGDEVASFVERLRAVEVGQAMPDNTALNLSREAASIAAKLAAADHLGRAWGREAAERDPS